MDGGVQATGRRIGEGWCRRRQSNERGGGFATRKWGLRVLSPIERARPRFSLVRSPRAHPGGEDGLGSPDGLRAYSGGKRGTRDAAGPNNAVRMKKMPAGGLVGETAGGALSHVLLVLVAPTRTNKLYKPGLMAFFLAVL
jgi:hypothetical protein